MSDTIKYEEIKDRSVTGMLKSGALTTKSENGLANNQGKLWGNLLGALEDELDWNALENLVNVKPEEGGGQKGIRKVIQAHLKKLITASGEELERNEKGGVIWSKDKKTKPIMKYTSDIAKIVAAGMSNELLPGNNTFASRCDILKACKPTLSSVEKIRLAITQIEQIVKGAEAVEYSAIYAEISTLAPTIDIVKPTKTIA